MSREKDTNKDAFAVSKKESLFCTVENGELNTFLSFNGEFDFLGDRDGNGETYLHRVLYKCTNEQLYNSCKDMITYILAEAPQLTETKNMNGETPLCLACKLDVHYQAIVQLLEVNPKMVMVTDIEQKTPLHHFLEPKAVLPNTLDSINNDVSRLFDGNTSTRQLEIVKLLISHGADMNAEDKNGNNVLHFTLSPINSELKIIDEDILQFLLQKGATFTTFSDLVHSLIAVKTLDTAVLIIKNHASQINTTDEKGWTVLHHVIENYSFDQEDIIEYLIEIGAVVEGGTNLMSVLGKRYHGFRLIEKVLDKYPEYVNARINYDGTTLLMRYCGDAEIVENLLLRGADVSLVNYFGDHALLHAAKSRNRKTIKSMKLLLDVGSNPILLNKDKKDILYLIFCHMKKCAGSSSDTEETENLENTYIQEFEEWYELFKYVLNLPPYKEPGVIMDPYLSFIFFRLIDIFADAHTRSIKLIKPLEMLQLILQINPQVCKIMALRAVRPFKNQLMSIQFYDSFVEPITSLLLSNSYCYLYNTLVEFIHAMLDAGFPVNNTPPPCVTPLTAVLIRKYQTANARDIESREHVLKLAKELIVRNVNVGSMALTIKDSFEIIHNVKVQFILPDALFLAFLNNEVELVEMLIPHWWAPPIALMLFKIPIIDENIDLFVSWFTFLLKYGRIPHGCDLYNRLKIHMENWFEELLFAYPAGHEVYYKWHPISLQFNQLTRNPLTLRELSKFAVRRSLAVRASYPGTSLPALLQEAVAPTLQFLVMM